jgi:hypothetical protein
VTVQWTQAQTNNFTVGMQPRYTVCITYPIRVSIARRALLGSTTTITMVTSSSIILLPTTKIVNTATCCATPYLAANMTLQSNHVVTATSNVTTTVTADNTCESYKAVPFTLNLGKLF